MKFATNFIIVEKFLNKKQSHFVLNSASNIDGKMFSGNRTEMYAFLEHIKRVTGDNSWNVEYGSDKENSYNSDYEAV